MRPTRVGLTLVASLTCLVFCPGLVSGSEGCVFLRDDRTIRCQKARLQEVRESLHVLTAVVRNRPRAVELEECHSAADSRLPRVFDGLSSDGVREIRIRRCGIRDIESGSFDVVAGSLRDLDLSHNELDHVPGALERLAFLERLDLRHNRIAAVRPGGALGKLPRLKELSLAHNRIGRADDDTMNGYRLKGTIGLDDFGLGRSSRSLQSLNLRGNELAAVPDQMSDLPELRHLDLAENVIAGVGPLALPRLESLNLHSNRIQGLAFDALTGSITHLDLTENPLHCDCSVLWLQVWANVSEVRLPSCHSPDRLKGRTLDRVDWDSECPDDNATFRYMMRGSGGEYDVMRATSTTTTTATISWRIRKDGGWTVVFRRESDSPYQMTLASGAEHRGDVLTQTLTGLEPGTHYIVCLALVRDTRYTIEPGKCARVATLGTKPVKTRLDSVKTSSTSITVAWWLVAPGVAKDGSTLRHEWAVRVRKTGTSSFTDIPIYDITEADKTDGQRYEYEVGDLSPRTSYDVCLMDVEHRPLDAPLSSSSTPTEESCVSVHTDSQHSLRAAEIAAVVFACTLCLVVSVITIALCRQKKLLKWPWSRKSSIPEEAIVSRDPPLDDNPPTLRGRPVVSRHDYAGSWNAVSLSYADFNAIGRPEFRSFRTLGYRDALSSVTIYSSGFSEC